MIGVWVNEPNTMKTYIPLFGETIPQFARDLVYSSFSPIFQFLNPSQNPKHSLGMSNLTQINLTPK